MFVLHILKINRECNCLTANVNFLILICSNPNLIDTDLCLLTGFTFSCILSQLVFVVSPLLQCSGIFSPAELSSSHSWTFANFRYDDAFTLCLTAAPHRLCYKKTYKASLVRLVISSTPLFYIPNGPSNLSKTYHFGMG